MILTCPDCATRYSAKNEAIGANGRTVRCSKCDATWFVEADKADIDLPTADEIALKEMEREEGFDPIEVYKPVPTMIDTAGYKGPDRRVNIEPGAHVLLRRKKDRELLARKMTGVRLTWGAALTLLLITVGWGVSQRHDIVQKHPRMATLYQAFGLPVSQSGLTFDSIKTRNSLVDGQAMLIVNGTVRNIKGKQEALPLVELAFLDVGGDAITTWLVDLPAQPLATLGKADFAAQYPNPPLDAVSLRYRFANSGVIHQSPDS